MTEPVKKQIPIAEATVEQLAEFAQSTLGIEIKPKTPPHVARAKITAVYDKDYITLFVRDTEQVAAPEGAREAMDAAKAPSSPDKVKILIQTKDEEGGDEPVFVRVNGKGMWIPRGEVVEVPVAYVEALEHAVMWVYPESKIDPRTGDIGGLGKPRAVYTYPFQRVA